MFLECRALLVKIVSRIVGPSDIEDIVQETFVRSFQAEVRGKIRHPRAYLLRTAANLALTHVSSADQKLTDRLADFDGLDVYLTSESLEVQYESSERFQWFCRAASELPAQCRRAFLLRKVYGMSQRQVAEYLGISESTVEKHVAKAMLMCADYLETRTDRSPPARGAGHRKSSGRSRRHPDEQTPPVR